MKGNNKDKKKSLFLIPDWSSWVDARQWTYLASYLNFEDSLKFFDSEIQIIPCQGASSVFLNEKQVEDLVSNICENKKYEYIFFWLPYLNFNKKILEKLKKNTKQFIVFITESLLYNEQDYIENPSLNLRWENITSILKSINPKIVSCCRVTSEFLKHKGFHVYFTYNFIPEDFKGFKTTSSNQYFVAATLYNDERKIIFESIQMKISETDLKKFKFNDDKLLVSNFESLMNQLVMENKDLLKRNELSLKIQSVRKKIWANYLKKMSKTKLIFSLPSYFKGLPGVIAEASLLKKPVYFMNSNLDIKDINYLKKNKNFFFEDIDKFDYDKLMNNSQSYTKTHLYGFSKFSDFFLYFNQQPK